ncbi:hypothetical protein G6O69_28365 [Pseudenhygromyxa sp. WMMC2535]|uniref:hypothetical protein n=1 Tax=Pseudenhygromyxa sp. WMMC2535 TaxID=2712867 RepID=UPI0015574D43|nr:hypothetical protein [Pseudenhygromyxa sp. WMMC2535]NVB41781.1 hypothetical protein [Pseudenhygromyxa sp. WMMC2535]
MYDFDDSRRPLVVARLRGRLSAEDIARFEADIDDLVDHPKAHVLLYDIAEVELPERQVIMEILRWTQDLRRRFRANYEDVLEPIPTFTAYYMPSRLGSLLGFFLEMSPQIRNQQMHFSNYEEALAACEDAVARFEFLDASASASHSAPVLRVVEDGAGMEEEEGEAEAMSREGAG